MITSINEFKQHLSSINEVRIPTGTFQVTGNFLMPDIDGWDVVFSKGDILNIVPTDRKILRWNRQTEKWDAKTVDWNKFMNPEFYKIFKDNSERMDPEAVDKATTGGGPIRNIEFVSSVKGLDRKVQEYDLAQTDRVKVKVL